MISGLRADLQSYWENATMRSFKIRMNKSLSRKLSCESGSPCTISPRRHKLHCRGKIIQSWALSVFLNFFKNKK